MSTHHATAAHGHLMEYRVTGHDDDGTPRLSQHDAVHSDRCPCVGTEDERTQGEFQSEAL
ncbi:hypothetical protein [Streptomyces sp. NPDC018055]|uniref:hypothetical protein n=1 Tax=Streptomyces sp. NPDC018055 TaxID=3365038 RepID=UPI0037A40959